MFMNSSHLHAGSGPRALRAFCALSLALICAVPAGAGEPVRTGPAVPALDRLQALVKELVALESEEAAEQARWREQQAHLDATRHLRAKRREALDAAHARSADKAQAVRAKTADAREARRAKQALLGRLAKALDGRAARLLDLHDRLPPPGSLLI